MKEENGRRRRRRRGKQFKRRNKQANVTTKSFICTFFLNPFDSQMEPIYAWIMVISGNNIWDALTSRYKMKCIPFYHLICDGSMCEPKRRNYYLSFQHLNFISFEFICVKFHLRCKMQKLVSIFKRKTIKNDCNSQFTNKYKHSVHTLSELCTVHCEHCDCAVYSVLCTIYIAIKIQLSLFAKWECVCICARNGSVLPSHNQWSKL